MSIYNEKDQEIHEKNTNGNITVFDRNNNIMITVLGRVILTDLVCLVATDDE